MVEICQENICGPHQISKVGPIRMDKQMQLVALSFLLDFESLEAEESFEPYQSDMGSKRQENLGVQIAM